MDSANLARCPACQSTNVSVWERWSDAHKDIIGGKDCIDCHAMSRRWIGKGVGVQLWTQSNEGVAGDSVGRGRKSSDASFNTTLGSVRVL